MSYGTDGEENVERERDFFLFFISFFASFSDPRKLDHRLSSGLKVKLIHVARTTCKYQNLGVLANFKGREFSYLYYF